MAGPARERAKRRTPCQAHRGPYLPKPSSARRCPGGSPTSTACCTPLEARGLDGIVATTPNNVFYLSSFNGIAHKSDEPRVCAVVLSRHAPEHPILVIADYYLATFLTQPTWIEDIRPFRAVMMPLDLPAKKTDIDRFIPTSGFGQAWVENARRTYGFDMGSVLKGALAELKLDTAKVAFDDRSFGLRLGIEGMTVADGYDPHDVRPLGQEPR